MSDKPETLAAILAEMRDLADHRAADAGGERPAVELLRSYADRIEAAAEREREAYCEICKEKDAAYDRLLLERDRAIKERTPGNASSCAPMSLDEAIKHAEERADGSPCGQAHAQLAGWLRELRDLRNATGNAAALHEALTAFVDSIQWLCDGDERGVFKKQFAPLLSEARAALSEPARNCDRFSTAEEARAAFEAEHSRGIVRNLYTATFDWLFARAEGGAE